MEAGVDVEDVSAKVLSVEVPAQLLALTRRVPVVNPLAKVSVAEVGPCPLRRVELAGTVHT